MPLILAATVEKIMVTLCDWLSWNIRDRPDIAKRVAAEGVDRFVHKDRVSIFGVSISSIDTGISVGRRSCWA